MPGADPVTERVADPEPFDGMGMLNGLRENVSPEGETVGARITVPAKLFKLAKLIGDVSEALKLSVRDGLVVEILKSCTLTTTCVENEIAPEVPVTIRVTLPANVPLT